MAPQMAPQELTPRAPTSYARSSDPHSLASGSIMQGFSSYEMASQRKRLPTNNCGASTSKGIRSIQSGTTRFVHMGRCRDYFWLSTMYPLAWFGGQLILYVVFFQILFFL